MNLVFVRYFDEMYVVSPLVVLCERRLHDTLVDLPDDRQAIENKWIFKKKTDVDGNVTIYKARLVAKGFRQVQGVDYDETLSPVVMLKSVQIMLAIAAFYDMKFVKWMSKLHS